MLSNLDCLASWFTTTDTLIFYFHAWKVERSGRHGQWPDFTFLLYQSKWSGKRNLHHGETGAGECNANGTTAILQRHSFIPLYAALLSTLPLRSKASWRRSKGQLSDHWARKSAGMAQHQAQSSSLHLSKWSNIYQSSLLSLLPPPSSFLPKDKNYH